jgi:hypothetical protein
MDSDHLPGFGGGFGVGGGLPGPGVPGGPCGPGLSLSAISSPLMHTIHPEISFSSRIPLRFLHRPMTKISDQPLLYPYLAQLDQPRMEH